ncbi:hypothetical protein GCM10027035_48060 [Emticicia sediminis]
MKKTLGILLVASSLSFAALAIQFNQEQVIGIVIVDDCVAQVPTLDFTFAEMKLLPLDVFATPEMADDFLVQKTCEGYTAKFLKPPISLKPGKAANINYSATDAFEPFRQSSYLYGNFLSNRNS